MKSLEAGGDELRTNTLNIKSVGDVNGNKQEIQLDLQGAETRDFLKKYLQKLFKSNMNAASAHFFQINSPSSLSVVFDNLIPLASSQTPFRN